MSVLTCFRPATGKEPANTASKVAFTGIDLICTKCYFKTEVSAALTIDSTTPLNETFSKFTKEVVGEFVNITKAFGTWVEGTANATGEAIVAIFDPKVDVDDIDFPDLEIDVNIDLPTGVLPKTNFQIAFNSFELYLAMALKIDAGVTYTIPLMTPAGLGIGKSSKLYIGAIVALELIMIAEDDVDLSFGVHIALDNDARLELELFGKSVKDKKL